MEIALAAGTMLLSGLSAASQKSAYESAADESRAMAERNAQREEAETREQVRQQREEQKAERGRAVAAAGASGALASSTSHSEYVQGLWDEAQREIDWTIRSGKSRAQIQRDEGDWAGRTAEARGRASWWSTLGSGVGTAGSILL